MIFIFCQGVGETNGRRPTNGDLAGFWDMVMIQVKSYTSWVGSVSKGEAPEFLCRSHYYAN